MAAQPPLKRPPLLDLTTLITRPVVRIDGVDYETYDPDELSVLANARLMKLASRARALEEVEEPTEEQDQEHQQVLDAICRKVLMAPEEVQQRLTSTQRAIVAVSFIGLRLQRTLPAAGEIAEAHATVEDAAAAPSDNLAATTGAS